MKEYSNLLRLKYDHIQIKTDKRYATVELEKDFFKSKALIAEEKIDGSQCAIGWKGGMPYVQGRSGHIFQYDKRVAFDGLWSWIWQNVAKVEATKGHLVFGEWMKPMHSISYDCLPDFFVAFDVWNLKTKRFLDYEVKTKFLLEWRIHPVPIIYMGKLKKEQVPSIVDGRPSLFSTEQNCEGCVIKNYRTQQFLKYVSREFAEIILNDEVGHWTSRREVKYNTLESWRQKSENA